MKLSEATSLIRETARRMDAICAQPVFDEFGIVQRVGDRHELCWYQGKRRQDYIRNFRDETALLKEESVSRLFNRYEIGDFEFVPDASGTEAEAFVVIGDDLYLICTNTVRSMSEIAADPRWLSAQAEFVEMGDRFGSDPVDTASIVEREEIRL